MEGGVISNNSVATAYAACLPILLHPTMRMVYHDDTTGAVCGVKFV